MPSKISLPPRQRQFADANGSRAQADLAVTFLIQAVNFGPPC
jgi:hypothetical protein